MLTAILDGRKIVSIDPAWADRKEAYRAICNERAVCPICMGRIVCRFGEIKVHHFAHHRNDQCPGDNDTVEHMEGKAVLYQFLRDSYEDGAKIDIEPYFEEINQNGDLLVEFNNGRKWAIEFYCGAKEKDILKKIDYYKDQNIATTWLLSSKLFRHITEQRIKIPGREQHLITHTGLDKLYIDDWYRLIVTYKQRRALPRDSDSRGSLMYLDVAKNELVILRAIQTSAHYSVFSYGSLLKGSLEELVIRDTEKWGVIWHLKAEEAWKPKYIEAKETLAKLEAEDRAEAKARAEKKAKHYQELKELEKVSRKEVSGFCESSPNAKTLLQGDLWQQEKAETNVSPRQVDIKSGWGTDTGGFLEKYRCIYCEKEFPSGDMVIIPRMNVPEGTCRECARKKGG